jgi:hypothetical protein
VYTFGIGKGQHAKPIEKAPPGEEAPPLSSDDLAAVILERLQDDDPEEYRRIRSRAYGELGSIHIAMLNRDPNNAAALHQLQINMMEVVKEEYEEKFTFLGEDEAGEDEAGEEAANEDEAK